MLIKKIDIMLLLIFGSIKRKFLTHIFTCNFFALLYISTDNYLKPDIKKKSM